MRLELETKILKINKKAVLAKLGYAEMSFEGTIESTYYDAKPATLRLSIVKGQDYYGANVDQGILTVKNDVNLKKLKGLTKVTKVPDGFKLKEEYDLIINLEEAYTIDRMMALLGYTQLRSVFKRRETWGMGSDVKLEFDSIKGVPEWLELEMIVSEKNIISGVKEIQGVVEQIGYTLDDLSSVSTLKLKKKW